MSFNLDKSKQAQEIILSRKTQQVIHLPTIFNNMPVVLSCSCQLFSCSCQKHLGIYLDEKLNFSNHIKEKISKANKGIDISNHRGNSDRRYKELVLKTLKFRRWLKKLCCFYKIKNNGITSYLAELIPSESHLYNTWA